MIPNRWTRGHAAAELRRLGAQDVAIKWSMLRTTVVPPTDGVSVASANIRPLYERYNAYRAEVIDGATYVEGILDAVLCDAMAGTNETLRARFRSFVLAAESFSFFQKWRALRGLSKEDPTWLREPIPNASGLIRDLKDVIGDRNKFAHGEITVDRASMSVLLRYYEDGEKTLELTEPAIESIIERMRRVYLLLDGIHLKFHGVM